MKCHHPQGRFPDLVARAAAGDRVAVGELLERYREPAAPDGGAAPRPPAPGRVDASDVIQEGYLDAMRRLDEFIRDPTVPFYIWLRFLVGQRVQEQHRRHLATPGRDVGREVSIYRGAMPGASTGALAARLLGKLTSPSQAAMRAERKIRLQEALNRMDPLDREILVLRHYEQMTNGDAAAGPGPGQVGGEQALHPGAGAAQGDPGRLARRDVEEPDHERANRSIATPSRSSPSRSWRGSGPASGRASRSTPPATPSWPIRSASCCRRW